MFGRKKTTVSGGFTAAIVGLGNPGLQYENTRHNAGFMALDLVAKAQGCALCKTKFHAQIGGCEVGGEKVLLCKPQTFMNNSGEAVRALMRFYRLPPERVILLYDDVNLDVGRVRIRRKGSDGGHNGMKSILALCGSEDFPRVRIGVGAKPTPEYDLAAWVLSRFRPEERETLRPALEAAAAAAALIVRGEIDRAMNLYSK